MNLRKRIAVFLCLLLTVPAIMGALPQAALEAQAATTTYLSWQGVFYDDVAEFQMAKSTSGFYVGDYLYGYASGSNYKYYGTISMNSGVKYKSSNPAVAAVNSTTGLVTPKKTGSTKITISFKGASQTCTIKVVSNLGACPSTSYKALKSAASALVKGYGKKLTASNRYKVTSLYNRYIDEMEEAPYSDVNRYYGLEIFTEMSGDNYININKVRIPILAHANAIGDNMEIYFKNVNPIGTGGAKLFKVSSVSGKGSVVNAKLNAKVNADQIFGIKAAVSGIWDTNIASGNTAKFPVYVKDMSTGHRNYGIAIVTKGKNTLSIKLQNSTLKKNRTYKLLGVNTHNLYKDWTNWGKTTFKAK